MRKIILATIFIVSIMTENANSQTQTFTLKSSDIGGQATVTEEFDGFGCTGKNISPKLSWVNPPVGTKSFAVTMYDPDAPTGSGWWHWLVFDIPANVHQLDRNFGAQPEKAAFGIQSNTDYGKPGYGGPCPPKGHGLHQYMITVYALNTEKLGLDAKTNAAVVGFNINAHTIGKASLVMYYSR